MYTVQNKLLLRKVKFIFNFYIIQFRKFYFESFTTKKQVLGKIKIINNLNNNLSPKIVSVNSKKKCAKFLIHSWNKYLVNANGF